VRVSFQCNCDVQDESTLVYHNTACCYQECMQETSVRRLFSIDSCCFPSSLLNCSSFKQVVAKTGVLLQLLPLPLPFSLLSSSLAPSLRFQPIAFLTMRCVLVFELTHSVSSYFIINIHFIEMSTYVKHLPDTA